MNCRSLYENSIGRVPGLKRLCQRLVAPMVKLVCRANGLTFPPDFPLWSQFTWAVGALTEEDRQTFATYRRFTRPGGVVLDIGANLGLHARQFARIVGKQGRVYAFEPTPEVFGCLTYNTRRWPNITCVCKAAFRENTTLSFGINSVSCTGNAIATGGADQAQTITVEAVSLDSWAANEKTGRVDFVKIDVEGAECDVLAGMANLVRANPELVLVIEYCLKNLAQFNVTPAQYFNSVEQLGLKLFRQDAAGNFQSVENVTDLNAAHAGHDYINLLAAKSAAVLNQRGGAQAQG